MGEAPARLTLWGIEVFVAIAEEGSISAAARRVGASPSAVSQQLSNLEAALGADLLDRTGRPLSLTPAGETFRRRAQVILDEAQQARAELAAGDFAHLTRLRLGMIEDFDADVTPALLTAMAGELALCRFLLETGASHSLTELLDARALDVIVAADLDAAPDWAEAHPLMEEPFVAALPAGRQGPAARLSDLADLPLIHYTQRHHMGRQIAAHLARQDAAPAHRFELDSYHAILAMVADGAGWAILTPLGYFRARRFADAAAMVPLPGAPLSRTISLTARRGVLGDMPRQIAGRLRPLLADLIVGPARARFDWLEGRMRVLE